MFNSSAFLHTVGQMTDEESAEALGILLDTMLISPIAAQIKAKLEPEDVEELRDLLE